MGEFLKNLSIKRAFSNEKRAALYRSLSIRSKYGFSLADSLDKYGKTYQKMNQKIGTYIDEIAVSLQSGNDIKSAFRPFVPNNELVIIAAGDENVSKLSDAFSDAAMLCTRQHKLNQSFKKVIRSFLIKLLVVFVFLIVMSNVAGQMLEALEIDNPVFLTRWLQAFANHMSSFWFVWLGISLLVLFSIKRMLPNYIGRFRSFLSKHIFPFTAYRLLISSSFLVGFSSLIGSKSNADALKTISDSSDPYLKYYASNMHSEALCGMSSSHIYDVELFDPFMKVNLIDLIDIPNSENNLKDLAQYEMDLSEERFKKINEFFNVLILLIMAACILWVYLAIGLPLYDKLSQL